MIPDNARAVGQPMVDDEPVDPEDVLRIVEKHDENRAALLAILGDIQDRYRYLPQDALRIVAQRTGCSLVDVYSAATFYRSFSLTPKGKHPVCVCLGTACHVRGAPRVAEEFERQLGVKGGETTPDGEFTLDTMNCLGACALGPVVVIDGRYFSKVRASNVRRLVDGALTGFYTADIGQDPRLFPIAVGCPHCNHSLMDHGFAIDGCPSVLVSIAHGDRRGWLRLSSLYGSYSISAEHEVPLDAVVRFHCPHCEEEMIAPADCAMCGAPMVTMSIEGGGTVRICSRRGCRAHMLDLV